jgi:hypothetical protein
LLDLALGDDGETCVQPKPFQKAGIAIQAAAAKLLNVTIGVGAGISGAGGNRVGVSFTFSQQVVVSPNGQAAFATVFTSFHSIPFAYVSPSAGGYGGFQLSISNAKTPKDIGGLFLSGGIGGGKGWGGGVDAAGGVGTQGNFVWQVTGTGPFGYSVPTSVGHATAFTNTLITPICKD